MLFHMKLSLSSTLLCSAACLWFAACSPGPETDEEPVAGPTNGQVTDGGQAADAGQDSSASTAPTNPLANRLRLPDMEKLPSDRELATKDKPDKGSGGVIARPPSE